MGCILQCSDALVGYDTKADVCDGDELSDPGISLISPEPRPLPPASPRLTDLRDAESCLAEHIAAPHSGVAPTGYVVRLHRLYADSEDPGLIGAAVGVALASLFGVGLRGLRTQTNLLHVEDAAYGLTLAVDALLSGSVKGSETVVLTDPAVWTFDHLLRSAARVLRLPPPLLPLSSLLLPPLRLAAAAAARLGSPSLQSHLALTDYHCYFTGLKAATTLGFTPKASSAGVHAALSALRARTFVGLRLVAPLIALSAALAADAHDKYRLAAAALATAIAALIYAALPPPATMPAQPPIPPPLVSGGVPVLGHLLQFIKGPVGMIDNLRSSYRSMFTIRVGPQRITFMIGAGPQLQFIKAKDEILDQAPVYNPNPNPNARWQA